MYHRFGDPAEQYQIPYWLFAQQLDWLQASGYTTVTLTQVYDYLEGVGSLPANPVVLTFDDGFTSQWDAVQMLDARGMTGVFFITTGQPHLADWQIRAMADAGHEIAAHTIRHPVLTAISDEQLWEELSVPKAELEAAAGRPVEFLAYPYGEYDARVIAATQAAGYRGAVAAWGGQEWTPEKWWFEPRIEIPGYLSLEEFVAYVR
jgi:peptidoglycan/xylan/chitin deacetylase (PgdA/CDA1 family)